MLVEPRPPDEFGMVAGLQQGLHALRAAAPDKPEMAAMRARHRLDDDAGLAMLPCAEDKAVVAPFHIERVLRLLRIRLLNILRLVKLPLHINICQNRIYKAAGEIGGGCTMAHRRMNAIRHGR